MSRGIAEKRHQRERAIKRRRRQIASWSNFAAEEIKRLCEDEVFVKRLASHRGICGCSMCKPWKHGFKNCKRERELARVDTPPHPSEAKEEIECQRISEMCDSCLRGEYH